MLLKQKKDQSQSNHGTASIKTAKSRRNTTVLPLPSRNVARLASFGLNKIPAQIGWRVTLGGEVDHNFEVSPGDISTTSQWKVIGTDELEHDMCGRVC
jgi:hypothetical protein